MAGNGRKWLIGCGVGCAVVALLAIVVTVGGGFLLTRPFNKAASTQERLAEAHGKREEYVPPLAGMTKDQVKRFIGVRRDLEPMCVTFTDIASKFEAMEDFDNREDEPGAGETIRAVGGVMGAAMGLAGNIGNFTLARNEALLAREMSLGEYAWIYVLVYNSWLGHPPNEGFDSDDGGSFARSERRALRAMLVTHGDQLVQAGRGDEAEIWRAEAEMMVGSDAGAPFVETSLPRELQELLAPYRDKLEGLYCPATASFEWSRIRKKGLSFHSE